MSTPQTTPVPASETTTPAPSVRDARRGILVMTVLLALVPWIGLYPVFVMKALCFALFACAFNLLIGFGGLQIGRAHV